MLARGPHPTSLRLLGGALCLDFANTVDPRHGPDRQDYLQTYSALVHWGAHAGALEKTSAARLLARAKRRSRAATETHTRALHLREALYCLFTQARHGGDEQKALALVSGELAHALSHAQLVRRADGFARSWATLTELDAVLWPVLVSAEAVLTSAGQRVHECPGIDGCGWLFLDNSKNHSRRWCSMRVCGNRAKARRHHQRASEHTSRPARPASQ